MESEWFQAENRSRLDELARILRELPQSAVADNENIDTFLMDRGTDNSTFTVHPLLGSQTIQIGNNAFSNAEFGRHVRHEIGHAVELELDRERSQGQQTVRAWLSEAFGWRMYRPSVPDDMAAWLASCDWQEPGEELRKRPIRALLHLALGPNRTPERFTLDGLDSWIADWQNETNRDLGQIQDSAERTEIAANLAFVRNNAVLAKCALAHCLGDAPQSAVAALAEVAATGSCEWAGQWLADDCGPKLICRNSRTHWWDGYDDWHAADGIKYCLNYQYCQLMAVSDDLVGELRKSLDAYAMMSAPEFFAELFGEYYNREGEEGSRFPAAQFPQLVKFFTERVDNQTVA